MSEATRPGESAPKDGATPNGLPAEATWRRPGRWGDIRSGTPPYGEGHRVVVYTEGYDFAGEQFFHIDADALTDFEDPETPHSRDREVAEHASHWIYDHDLRALIAKEHEQPATAYVLHFPTMLRRMWSGGEVQTWLDQLPPLYATPQAAARASVEGLSALSDRFDERNVNATGEWRAAVEDRRTWLDELLGAVVRPDGIGATDDAHEREHVGDADARTGIYPPRTAEPAASFAPADSQWDRARLDAALDDLTRTVSRMCLSANGGTDQQKADLGQARERIHQIVRTMGRNVPSQTRAS